MRVLVLGCLGEIVKSTNYGLFGDATSLISQLIGSIKNDISSLEERPVVDLVDALTKIIAQDASPKVTAEARQLLGRVHGVVSDMAVENADLVDTSFIMDYLNSINPLHKRRGLDREKTEAFLAMFRAKCQEEGTQEFVRDYLANTQLAIQATRSYGLPELEDLLVGKWTDGKRAYVEPLGHF